MFEKITTNKIKERILVFGDIIFDKFVFTQSLGKSRKIILFQQDLKTELYDGGSLMMAKISLNILPTFQF